MPNKEDVKAKAQGFLEALAQKVREALGAIFCGDRLKEAVRVICGLPFDKLHTIN